MNQPPAGSAKRSLGLLGERERGLEPGLLERRLVQRDEAVDEIGVVFEIRVQLRRRTDQRRPQQPAVGLAHLCQQPASGGSRRVQVRRLVEARPAIAIAPIMRPFHAVRIFSSRPGLMRVSRTSSSRRFQPSMRSRLGDRQLQQGGILFVGAAAVQDAHAFPVAAVGDVEDAAEKVRVPFSERRLDLGGGPDEELPLLAFAVGVLRAEEGAGRARHLAEDVVERLLGDFAIERVAGDLKCLDIGGNEKGVVVEHLLEVRDEPAGVGAVAMEAAAELVVHAAAGHQVERVRGHPSASRRRATVMRRSSRSCRLEGNFGAAAGRPGLVEEARGADGLADRARRPAVRRFGRRARLQLRATARTSASAARPTRPASARSVP